LVGERVLEIRTYRIRDGKRDEFGRRVSAVLPLLQRYGIDVVGHGPSIEDAEHYVLLRSFASLDQLDEQERAFYESDEWRAGPREGILELIETYHTVVLRSTDARGIAYRVGLRRRRRPDRVDDESAGPLPARGAARRAGRSAILPAIAARRFEWGATGLEPATSGVTVLPSLSPLVPVRRAFGGLGPLRVRRSLHVQLR